MATITHIYKASHRRRRDRQLLWSKVCVALGLSLMAAAAVSMAALHL